MANAYIHLDSVDTLEQYRHKLQNWKERLYALNNEMRNYHNSLEQDQFLKLVLLKCLQQSRLFCNYQ